jgi:tetratricopeptide (TPR) repeat protein
LTSTGRIQQLLRFLEEDPDDPFTRYALALEYLKTEPEKAAELFHSLINRHPDYLPAYYMAAKLLAVLDKREEALILLDKGVALATRLNDHATLRELKEARQLMEND